MKSYKLKDICYKITDGSHNPPKGIEYSEYLMLSSKNVYNDLINCDEPRYLTKEEFEIENKRTDIKNGDVLLTIVGTVGRCAVFTGSKNNKVVLQRSVAVLKPIQDIINSRFLMYKLISITNILEREARGVAQKGIYLKQLSEIDIIIPKLEVQSKIVTSLDKAQELIDKRKEQIEACDELIKGLFYDMFGDPANNSKGWEYVNFGDVIDILTDYHANGSYEILRKHVQLLDKENYALMIRTTDLENKVFNKDVKYITKEAYEFLSKTKVYGGEIIINKIGSAGNVYLMPYLNRLVSLGMNQFMIRLNEKINTVFIYRLLTSKYGGLEISKRVQGAVTKTITKDAVRSIPIILPPIHLQNQFANKVQKIEQQKSLMRQSLTQLENNFNSLMQRAFKGELF